MFPPNRADLVCCCCFLGVVGTNLTNIVVCRSWSRTQRVTATLSHTHTHAVPFVCSFSTTDPTNFQVLGGVDISSFVVSSMISLFCFQNRKQSYHYVFLFLLFALPTFKRRKRFFRYANILDTYYVNTESS